MRKKHSKKLSKWRFLSNLKKYQTDFNNNSVKRIVTTHAPTLATFYVGVIIPKGGAGAKKVLKCYFCVTEGPKNMKFGIVVTYKITYKMHHL